MRGATFPGGDTRRNKVPFTWRLTLRAEGEGPSTVKEEGKDAGKKA